MYRIGLPEIQTALAVLAVYVLPYVLLLLVIVWAYATKKKLDTVGKETKRLADAMEKLCAMQSEKR